MNKNECLWCALGKEIRKCEDQFWHFWLTQLIKRVEDVVRTPGPLFRYTTTTIKKMFANTTTSAAAFVQHVVDHGRCVSFWCCCGLLFFESSCLEFEPRAVLFVGLLKRHRFCMWSKKEENTHTRTTLSPSRKKGHADRIDERKRLLLRSSILLFRAALFFDATLNA